VICQLCNENRVVVACALPPWVFVHSARLGRRRSGEVQLRAVRRALGRRSLRVGLRPNRRGWTAGDRQLGD
jgi:hypothetical protein